MQFFQKNTLFFGRKIQIIEHTRRVFQKKPYYSNNKQTKFQLNRLNLR